MTNINQDFFYLFQYEHNHKVSEAASEMCLCLGLVMMGKKILVSAFKSQFSY